MKPATFKTYSIESANAELASMGLSDVEIFDDPRDDGRITMHLLRPNLLGEEYNLFCLTDCMDAEEWMERFFEGRWFDIIPLPQLQWFGTPFSGQFRPRTHAAQA